MRRSGHVADRMSPAATPAGLTRRTDVAAADTPLREVYLHPGQLIASAEPMVVTTILGSCVAVCVWDAETGIGGMNHFLLPHHAEGPAATPRFGNVAMDLLLQKVLALGAQPRMLTAKVFGGACVLDALRDRSSALGGRNVIVAREALGAAAIPVLAEDVSGDRGRKLSFDTSDGSVTVRMLAGEAAARR